MADNDKPGSPNAGKVAEAGRGAAESAARDAASGAPADAVAGNAASSAAGVAEAAAPADAAATVRAVTATAGAGQSMAQAAQSGDPASAIGAVGGAAGMAGAVAGVAGNSPAAQTIAQVGSTTAQVAGAAQTVAGLAQRAPASSPAGAGPQGLLARATEAVRDAMVGAGRHLEDVHFEFALTQGPDIAWHVRRFTITSELSRIYEIHLELVCHDTAAPIDEMLGAPCELLVERGDLLHSFYGIVDEIDDVGPEQGRLHAAIRVIPAFGLLADQIDTRIFQGQTVIEILSEVLQAALEPYGRELDAETYIKRTYLKRDYCTQFRESTFAFCCRLMEEEGIAFHFLADEDGRRERLVLVDNNNDYPEVELAGYTEVPIIESSPEEADRESVRGALWRARRQLNKVSGRAYNFKAANGFEEGDASVQETHNHHDQELYLHDLRRQITDDPVDDPAATSFDGTALDQRGAMVVQVLEEHRAQSKVAHGTGNVTGFRAGTRFTLASHHRADLEGAQLLLVRVHHSGEANTSDAGATATYANEFTAIPIAHEFRPPQRHRRAKVYGPQLGRVVGEAGSDDEIHTDSYGRIKVLFHHDRLAPADTSASAWIRVIQPWAGPRWGTMFIPRVGMEVVVQFVDGNPDNPVVTGSVYNSDNMPPFALPDEKTKSTIKTSSSVGGDGYNELTFEDAAGQEQIIVHAQKDFNKTVLNNQSRSVGANDSTSVGGDQSLSVTGDRTHSVSGSETITITGSQKITITGSGTGDGQTVTGGQLDITGKYKLDASQSISVQAPDFILLTVGSTFLKIEPDKITMQAKDGARVVLAPASALMASKENSQVVLTADAHMQANTGGDLLLTANAQLSGAGAQVLLNGEALMKAKAGGEVKLNADAKMSGANATVDATTASTVSAGGTATLTAGGSTVKTASGAVDVSGPQANIAGSGAVNITGGIIKLN